MPRKKIHPHHHHHLYLPYLQNTKNLFTAVIARRRGDPGSHQAYGRATSLTLINKVKKKSCECAALGQFSDYLSKSLKTMKV